MRQEQLSGTLTRVYVFVLPFGLSLILIHIQQI